MSGYIAPIQEMRFVLEEVAGLAEVAGMPGGENATPDLVAHILEEAGKFASQVLAPLNRVGDVEGAVLENGVVRTAPGFKAAYKQWVAAGWNSVPFDPEHGGGGLPWVVATAVNEMWQASNMSFALMPLLTQGAIELLAEHGSREQKRLYLDRMIAGEWGGTMNLTEPGAGSDVGALRTRAIPADGHYKIVGQKIFITYGEQDWTDNIVHLVLARTPNAPPGPKGISLFIVPKFAVEPDGRLGARNDLRCVSLEHKLGINASPTCVMAYGDGGGATGFLVGEENRGLEYMFTMMNNARLNVGLQGVAIADRAYQQGRDFARTRVQSRELGSPDPNPAPIIRHPDVRRMLLAMRAQSEAARALAYSAMASLDLAKRHTDPAERARHQARVDLLTPVVKAWSTDVGVEVASLGIQVHGGMGFIEETGAAQHYRDARIAPIYEGTNGIQANDLVFRKLGRDRGAAASAFFAEVAALDAELAGAPGDDLAAIHRQLSAGLAPLRQATDWLVATLAQEPRAAAAGAAPYLRLFGLVAGGYLMARSALAAKAALAGRGDSGFYAAKIACARFFADHLLAQAPSLLHPIVAGAASVLRLDEDRF
ncbi:MAG TPA: acyl-CoA dehydrogenase [Alphaproteobacteria bacterium]|nr:acyl-CoA dehydrogenase [Alphaproteobacteria bacterium]